MIGDVLLVNANEHLYHMNSRYDHAMTLKNVKLIGLDATYTVSFSNPMLDILLKSNVRLRLLNSILNTFQLKLNDIKVRNDDESIAGNHFHFSKFHGQAFLDVRYGLEQVVSLVRNPVDKNQLIELFDKVYGLFKGRPMAYQGINLQHQFSIGENPASYLDSLNPHTPERFREYLQGKGVFYTLRFAEHDLGVVVTVVPSLFLQDGIFVAFNFELNPSRYDLPKFLQIAEEYYLLLLQELNLQIEGDVKHGL